MKQTIKILSILVFMLIGVIGVEGTNYYVDNSTGNNANNGLTIGTALGSVGAAILKVGSGDTIYIRKGEYNEYLLLENLTNANRITITSYQNENVNLTYVDNRFFADNTQWTNISNSTDSMWKTAAWHPNVWDYTIIHDNNGTLFLNYKNLTTWNSSGYPDGIYADDTNNNLYLRFGELWRNPNKMNLYVSREQLAIMQIHDSPSIGGILIENVTFKYGKAGIAIVNSSNIIINNVDFLGSSKGIYLRGDVTTNIEENITIKNSNFYGYFNSTRWDWKDIHETWGINYNIGMDTTAIQIWNAEKNILIDNNYIIGWSNGILDQSSSSLYRTKNVNISNNIINNIFDDGIEIEHYQDNHRVFNNTVYDSFISISLAAGNCSVNECFLYRNYLVSNKTINWSINETPTAVGECYKLGRTDHNTTNWRIYHNTCYAKDSIQLATASYSTHWANNLIWLNNVFYTTGNYVLRMTGLAEHGNLYDYNTYFSKNNSGLFRYWNSYTNLTLIKNLTYALSSTLWNGSWDINSYDKNINFRNKDNNLNELYKPYSNSFVIGNGVNIKNTYGYPDFVTYYGEPDIGYYEVPLNSTYNDNTPLKNYIYHKNWFEINITTDNKFNIMELINFNNSLYAWLPLNNESAVTAPNFINYNNNATTSNILLNRTDGVFLGSAVYKASSSPYILFQNQNLNINNSAACLWFKTNNRTSSQELISFYIDSSNEIIRISLDTSNQLILVSDFGISLSTGYYIKNINEWHHTCFTIKDANNASIFIDGKYYGSDTTITNMKTATNIYIGKRATGAEFLNGSIDEVVIYNKSLNYNEILSIYNASINPYNNRFNFMPNGTMIFNNSYVEDLEGNIFKISYLTFDLDQDYCIKNRGIQPYFNATSSAILWECGYDSTSRTYNINCSGTGQINVSGLTSLGAYYDVKHDGVTVTSRSNNDVYTISSCSTWEFLGFDSAAAYDVDQSQDSILQVTGMLAVIGTIIILIIVVVVLFSVYSQNPDIEVLKNIAFVILIIVITGMLAWAAIVSLGQIP